MVTIGTVLAELVAAAGGRLRQRRGRAEAHALSTTPYSCTVDATAAAPGKGFYSRAGGNCIRKYAGPVLGVEYNNVSSGSRAVNAGNSLTLITLVRKEFLVFELTAP